jgi:ABC-type multidrug transport system fused ATPase/permease subunit
MAYVPQDVAVLSGTVRGNVALGIPPEFINNSLAWRPLAREGIDTVVGENGVQLLVLDEATLRHGDQVIHLSAGRITGRGTFEQVRTQVPEFNRQTELSGL